jgi:type IV pilus assembly protein PilQ
MSHIARHYKLSLIMLLSSAVVISSAVYSAQADDISIAVSEAKAELQAKTLSFNFQNIEVRSLLQLIAKSSGFNFIISDLIKGNVTLNLKNVTWQQALSVILKTQGLTSRQVGNVIYVSTIEDITSNEAKLLQSADSMSNIQPLKSSFVSLRYATAKDIADMLKGATGNLLSTRGQVSIDSRTNSLIIRDTSENLRAILPEIRKLDVPAKQVLIEARIVNIDITYEEQIGVRFGTSNTRSLSGTLAGANQLAQGTSVANVTGLSQAVGAVPVQRLNFNVPASALFDGQTPGSIGLALAHLGKVYLDLELSALEGEAHAKIIASPRVVTSNQQKATIETGEEIPYQESSSSGATTVAFKKAVLSLEITPQITSNNKIVLNLKATQDKRGANTAVGATSAGTPINIPAIDTQAVQSSVLLNDNETIVVGGVYREIKTNNWDRIPFFGTLPIVGNFFSYKAVRNEKRELLIFITPKIITAKSRMAEAKMENGGMRTDGEG